MTLKSIIDFNVLSFDEICRKIRTGEHFSLARYGDGEFNAILGKGGANCDGHEYFPEMGRELADILKSNPAYYIGLHQNRKLQEETIDWLRENKIIGWQFVSNAVFHDPVRDGDMNKFWEACNTKNITIIGPEYLENQKVIKNAVVLPIPGENTYMYKDEILSRFDLFDFTDEVVLICASMTAPILVDYLYNEYQGTATFIDFGSSFDPFCGVKSRSFHKIYTHEL